MHLLVIGLDHASLMVTGLGHASLRVTGLNKYIDMRKYLQFRFTILNIPNFLGFDIPNCLVLNGETRNFEVAITRQESKIL